MKKIVVTVLLSLCLSPMCFSQGDQKFSYLQHHKPSDILWLSKKGFNMSNYIGDNKKINFNLSLALKHRKQSKQFFLYGGIGFVLGIVGINIALNRIVNGVGNEGLTFFYVSSIVTSTGFWTGLIGGLINNTRAKRHVNRAIEIQLDLD